MNKINCQLDQNRIVKIRTNLNQHLPLALQYLCSLNLTLWTQYTFRVQTEGLHWDLSHSMIPMFPSLSGCVAAHQVRLTSVSDLSAFFWNRWLTLWGIKKGRFLSWAQGYPFWVTTERKNQSRGKLIWSPQSSPTIIVLFENNNFFLFVNSELCFVRERWVWFFHCGFIN